MLMLVAAWRFPSRPQLISRNNEARHGTNFRALQYIYFPYTTIKAQIITNSHHKIKPLRKRKTFCFCFTSSYFIGQISQMALKQKSILRLNIHKSLSSVFSAGLRFIIYNFCFYVQTPHSPWLPNIKIFTLAPNQFKDISLDRVYIVK